MAEISARYPSWFTPAGYAFAIWGLIYFSFLAYAVAQILPSQRRVVFHDRLVKPFIGVNVLGSVWIVAFAYQQIAASVAIIVALLACASAYYVRATAAVRSGEASVWWRAPASLILGWIAVATIANVSILGASLGYDGAPLNRFTWTLLFLGMAAALGVFLAVMNGDVVVPLVVAWAATAIGVARRDDSTLLASAAWGVALSLVITAAAVMVGISVRRSHRHPPRLLEVAGRIWPVRVRL